MNAFWPWLAVAGLGALHGLNPATGWIFATASAVRRQDRSQAWRALLPIATGHLASLALAMMAMRSGIAMKHGMASALASGFLAILVITYCIKGKHMTAPAGWAGLTLWAFLMSTAHGAGLMLLPVMLPMCSAGSPGAGIAASAPLIAMLGAVTVHTTAMLVATGLMADSARRCFEVCADLLPTLQLKLRRPEETRIHGSTRSQSRCRRVVSATFA